VVPFDNSPIERPELSANPRSAVKSRVKKSVEKSGKRSCEADGTRSARSSREMTDPFSRLQYKQLIEPLYLIDKLDVLR